MRVIRWRKYIHKLSASFLEKYQGMQRLQKTKNNNWSRFFLVEGWSVEGHITKVVEWIVMNVGLLILHKTKALFL